MNPIKNRDKFINLLFILIFVTPVYIYGNNDIEEYQLGLFSSKIFWEQKSNFFLSFYDFYGPGTKCQLVMDLYFIH